MTHENAILIESGWKFVLSVSGGGEILGDLTKYGKMSGTLLEGIVPYEPSSFYRLIGGRTDQIVSPSAARAAAMACYDRAREYAPDHKNVFGFASTGAVVKTGGEREGRKHRVCMCIQDAERTIGINITYGVGRERLEEEALTARCIREALKWGCHRFGDVSKQLSTTAGDTLHVESKIAEQWAIDLLHGVKSKDPNRDSKAIFPSSFNPLHTGHLNIIADAAKRLGHLIDLELCIRNADKPPLDYRTIDERINGIAKGCRDMGTLFLTNKPMFFDKAKMFPGCTFVVGTDTFDRILDRKYYPCGGGSVLRGLDEMRDTKNRFLVYPRKGYTPVVRNENTLEFSLINKVTRFVSPYDGYEVSDLSSTALRSAARAES